MKYAFIGDIHGRPTDFEQFSQYDVVGCTGDYDSVSLINDFLDWKDRYESEGGKVLDVIGNHDEAAYENRKISSGTLYKQGKYFSNVIEELEKDQKARSYVERKLDEPYQRFKIHKEDALLVHGGLEGNLRSFPDCPDDKKFFWNRLWDERDYEQNLEAMDEKGLDIMIRGHDHEPELVEQDTKGELRYFYPEGGESFELDPDMKYLITHGAWYEGKSIGIDTEGLTTIEFHDEAV